MKKLLLIIFVFLIGVTAGAYSSKYWINSEDGATFTEHLIMDKDTVIIKGYFDVDLTKCKTVRRY